MVASLYAPNTDSHLKVAVIVLYYFLISFSFKVMLKDFPKSPENI